MGNQERYARIVKEGQARSLNSRLDGAVQLLQSHIEEIQRVQNQIGAGKISALTPTEAASYVQGNLSNVMGAIGGNLPGRLFLNFQELVEAFVVLEEGKEKKS